MIPTNETSEAKTLPIASQLNITPDLTWKRNPLSSHIWEIYAYSVFCVFRVYQLSNGTCWYRRDNYITLKAANLAHVKFQESLHAPLELPIAVQGSTSAKQTAKSLTLKQVQARAQRDHRKLVTRYDERNAARDGLRL